MKKLAFLLIPFFLTACGDSKNADSSALSDSAAELVQKTPLRGFLPPENLSEKLNEAPIEKPDSEFAKFVEQSPFGVILPPADILGDLNRAPGPKEMERIQRSQEMLQKFLASDNQEKQKTAERTLKEFLQIAPLTKSIKSKKDNFANQGDFEREE